MDWNDYSGDSDTENVSLLLSLRTQSLVLAAMRNLDSRSAWKTVDDATWDDIDAALGEAYEEIMEIIVSDNTTVGMVMAYTANTAPAKWLRCDGQEVAQATYPELYALIGATFGAAASGNFKLPHINGIQRFIRGFIPPPTSGQEIGVTGGATNMQLTVGHLPTHSHTIVKGTGGTGSVVTSAAEGRNESGTPQTTSSVGSGSPTPVQTVPPHVNLNYCIKALP